MDVVSGSADKIDSAKAFGTSNTMVIIVIIKMFTSILFLYTLTPLFFCMITLYVLHL